MFGGIDTVRMLGRCPILRLSDPDYKNRRPIPFPKGRTKQSVNKEVEHELHLADEEYDKIDKDLYDIGEQLSNDRFQGA